MGKYLYEVMDSTKPVDEPAEKEVSAVAVKLVLVDKNIPWDKQFRTSVSAYFDLGDGVEIKRTVFLDDPRDTLFKDTVDSNAIDAAVDGMLAEVRAAYIKG